MPLTETMIKAIAQRNQEIISTSMDMAFDSKEVFGDGAYMKVCEELKRNYELMEELKTDSAKMGFSLALSALSEFSNNAREIRDLLRDHPVAVKILFNEGFENVCGLDLVKFRSVEYYHNRHNNKMFSSKGDYVGEIVEETGEIIC